MLLVALTTAALAAEAEAPEPARWAVGLDFVPAALRSDLAWSADAMQTGTYVGELDGFIQPPLTAYFGAIRPRTTWTLGAAWARYGEVNWTPDGRRVTGAGAVRLAVDAQRYLNARAYRRPAVWVGLGVHGNIPVITDRSSSYTEEEAADAQEGRRATAGRVGGVGGRAGLGCDYELLPGLAVGMRAAVVYHRGQALQEDSLVASALWAPEAALRLQFMF
ncbi:MAG: hypothetical protein H6739_36275 [Alphaproteobacteria bacterium]|nr:hypothetical protein [Alphaproteobacteria bacterium]